MVFGPIVFIGSFLFFVLIALILIASRAIRCQAADGRYY